MADLADASAEGGRCLTDPAPAAPSTSLTPALAEAKASIESSIGDPNSSYWKDSADGTTTARGVRAKYRDLIAGELAGEKGYLGPPGGVDLDIPTDASRYDISSAPGASSMTAEDRAIVDRFLPAAHAAGLGQRKVAETIGFCLTMPGPISEELVGQFVKFAVERGWSDEAIEFCLDFASSLDGADEPAARAQATPAERTSVAEEKASLEALMGQMDSKYWRGPQSSTLQARYRELLAGG